MTDDQRAKEIERLEYVNHLLRKEVEAIRDAIWGINYSSDDFHKNMRKADELRDARLKLASEKDSPQMSDDQSQRDRKAAEAFTDKYENSIRESPFTMAGAAFLAGLAHARANPPAEVLALVEALESIAAEHLSEDAIKACGGDVFVTDTQIAREALAAYRAAIKQKDEGESEK